MSDIFSGLASLTKTVQETLNSYEVRKISDKVQSYVMNFTEPETKVRDATTEEAWGPTPDMMREIAGLTFQYDAFPEVMGMLWKRMLPPNAVAWRHTYKSLILLEHLLKNGCERVISNARDHAFEMRSLERYKCIDERGKDQGVNVRHRAKAVLTLLEDDDMLREERRKAKVAGKDDKYRGFSRDDMIMKGGSSSFSSSRETNFNKYDDSSRYDRDDRYDETPHKKEITSFGFDDDKRSVSPELGIRMDSPRNDREEDDEFGDFTVARYNTNKSATPAAKPSNSFDFGDFGSAIPPPPGPSSAAKPNNSNSIFDDDLFGSPSHATPVQQKKDDFDFLGLGGSSQRTTAIRPPSGPSSPTKDLFGSNNSSDLFGAPPVASKAAQDIFFGASNNVSKPSQDTFDFLGLDSVQHQPAHLVDLNNLPPSALSNFSKPNDDFFSAMGASPSFMQNNVEQKPTGTKNKEANKSALWNDLSGSLDLDNLLSTKPKQSVSMNEMKSKHGMPNSNSFM